MSVLLAEHRRSGRNHRSGVGLTEAQQVLDTEFAEDSEVVEIGFQQLEGVGLAKLQRIPDRLPERRAAFIELRSQLSSELDTRAEAAQGVSSRRISGTIADQM